MKYPRPTWTQCICGSALSFAMAGGTAAQGLLTIEARDDKPGPVDARVEARDSAGTVLDFTTVSWNADDNGWRSLPVGGYALPTGTTTVRIIFTNDEFTCCDPDDDRSLFVDFIDLDGRVCDGVDWSDAFHTDAGTLDDRAVAELEHENDWVEYTVAPVLRIEARDDKPGPVEAYVEAKDAGGMVLSFTTLLFDADDNGWRSLPEDGLTLPIGTTRVRVTFTNDHATGPGEDGDCNLFIDTYEVSGFTHEAENWCDAGGVTVGTLDLRTVAELFHNGDWVEYELAPAKQSVRLGTPANPFEFLLGSQAPVIGEVWNPVVTAFQEGGLVTVVAISGAPTNIPLGSAGTLLCDPTVPPIAVVPGTPGNPILIPIPENCGFVGLGLCTQGVSIGTFGALAFANALDIEIGSH